MPEGLNRASIWLNLPMALKFPYGATSSAFRLKLMGMTAIRPDQANFKRCTLIKL